MTLLYLIIAILFIYLSIAVLLATPLIILQSIINMQSKSQPDLTASQLDNNNILVSTHNQISQALHNRSQSIGVLVAGVNQIDPQKYLQASNKYKIVTHCNEYSKIVPLINNILTHGKDGTGLGEHEKFWQINQNLERQLQSMLRDLKSIDLAIDNIVNQEFDKCNQIDEIQQTIRIILSKKDANHISKAQPYYQQREKGLSILTQKKQEKQKIKQDKLGLIKQILSLLGQLKRHRESGLKMCQIGQKDKKAMENEQILIDRVVKDLKQIKKNEEQIASFGSEIFELGQYISDAQKNIEKVGRELVQLIEQQNQASFQLQSIIKLKSQTQYFETSLLNMLGLNYVKKKSKKDFSNEVQTLVSRIQKFSKENKQKEKQVVKIQQGIQTTKKTIGIFQHIMSKIQTENMRKKQLLKDIEKIQNRHSQQDKAISLISETENESEKLTLKKNQLNKNLESKMNEANVTAYKSIHQQILKIEAEIKNKGKQLQIYKQNASENARQLYDQTMDLQQNYEDILSEVVPSIWLKESDFTKEQSIRDLNLYLLKTFKRLSIAD